jgi:hypothetical protein
MVCSGNSASGFIISLQMAKLSKEFEKSSITEFFFYL